MKSKILTVANQKGGVAKTTTVVTLAHALALKGKSVLVIDFDPQGQAATALGLAPEACVFSWLAASRPISENMRRAREGLQFHVLPGDQQTAYAQILLAAKGEPVDYVANLLKRSLNGGAPDYILFDTSPSVGGLQERALYAADVVIIPSAVDYLSADAIARTMASIQKNVEWGWIGTGWILPTFYDEVTRESRQTLADLSQVYGDQVLHPIYRATVMRECAAEGITIWEKDSRSRPAEQYAKLLYRVLELR